mgnify:CR=1 FL=1|jgi:hypothetical protein
MKVGDLVRWRSISFDRVLPTLGLIISIQYHNYGPRLSRVRVRWSRGSFLEGREAVLSLPEYCYMSNLEVVSD